MGMKTSVIFFCQREPWKPTSDVCLLKSDVGDVCFTSGLSKQLNVKGSCYFQEHIIEGLVLNNVFCHVEKKKCFLYCSALLCHSRCSCVWSSSILPVLNVKWSLPLSCKWQCTAKHKCESSPIKRKNQLHSNSREKSWTTWWWCASCWLFCLKL